MKVKIIDSTIPGALDNLQTWADKDFTIDGIFTLGTKVVILYHE